MTMYDDYKSAMIQQLFPNKVDKAMDDVLASTIREHKDNQNVSDQLENIRKAMDTLVQFKDYNPNFDDDMAQLLKKHNELAMR